MNELHDLFADVSEQQFADPRTSMAHLQLNIADDQAHVSGEVLDQAAATALLATLRTRAPHITWHDETTPLVAGPDALVTWAVADVRRDPEHNAERLTQMLWGDACAVVTTDAGWALVRGPDGYLGWVDTKPLQPGSTSEVQSWSSQATHVVSAPLAPVFTAPERATQQQCLLLPFGARVSVGETTGQTAAMTMPDGQTRWLAASQVLPMAAIGQTSSDKLQRVVEWLPSLVGVPYLWGGKTPFGYDCSGLVQILYGLAGIDLPRDADQQYDVGQPVPPDQVKLGDLLFFDTSTARDELPSAPTKVTHVAFALDATGFVHASRSGGGVGWGSLDAASPVFVPGYRQRLVGVKRYLANRED